MVRKAVAALYFRNIGINVAIMNDGKEPKLPLQPVPARDLADSVKEVIANRAAKTKKKILNTFKEQ